MLIKKANLFNVTFCNPYSLSNLLCYVLPHTVDAVQNRHFDMSFIICFTNLFTQL